MRDGAAYPAYGPWFQTLFCIWKKPIESRSPNWRFFSPDSTSADITGSSAGIPPACAARPIHSATASAGASSPG